MMRAVTALLLGGWLLGTLLLAGVAAENFFRIDRLLISSPHPAFQKDVTQLPPGEARTMLRYLSSELNRFYFRVWGWVEVFLGIVLLAMAAGGLKRRQLVLGFSLMLAMAAFSVFSLTPRLVEVGRTLDFVPREPAPPALALFGRLHAAYTLLDLGKLLVGVWMAITIVRWPAATTGSGDRP